MIGLCVLVGAALVGPLVALGWATRPRPVEVRRVVTPAEIATYERLLAIHRRGRPLRVSEDDATVRVRPALPPPPQRRTRPVQRRHLRLVQDEDTEEVTRG